jgi:hypothetical protein
LDLNLFVVEVEDTIAFKALDDVPGIGTIGPDGIVWNFDRRPTVGALHVEHDTNLLAA